MGIIKPELRTHLIEKLRNRLRLNIGHEGYATNIPEKIERTLDDILLSVQKTAHPKGIYRILPILGTDTDNILTKAGPIQSTLFTRLAHACSGDRFIAFTIATLGNELEKISYPDTGIYYQWIFDKLGSELVEMVADIIEEDWKTQSGVSGLEFSSRFSPGYCDWPLKEQHVIFNSVDASQIDVCLTPHFVMSPLKSVSAISIAAKQVPYKTPCRFCNKRNCKWRKPS